MQNNNTALPTVSEVIEHLLQYGILAISEREWLARIRNHPDAHQLVWLVFEIPCRPDTNPLDTQ